MPNKDDLKSARKKFMVMKTKSTIMQLQNTADEDVDAKLGEVLTSLTKVFGEAQAAEILDGAIDAASNEMSSAIQGAVAGAVTDAIKKKDD